MRSDAGPAIERFATTRGEALRIKRSEIDINYIEPRHHAVHDRLTNWGRWAEERPAYKTCPMFRMARSSSRQWHPVTVKDHIDILDAAVLEKVVVSLPVPHKKAMIWFYVHRYGENKYRRQHGYTLDTLQKIVTDARDMVINKLTRRADCVL